VGSLGQLDCTLNKIPAISVVICTHNPRYDYLDRVLAALRAQTFDKSEWELLLVDNHSTESLASKWDITWNPLGRHIRESQVGLTNARLCGIREAAADLLVFVDDDNLLSPNYLEDCLEIANDFPQLGAWGGNVSGSFEVPPPEWLNHYLHVFALVFSNCDRWSNNINDFSGIPRGAGLCVRTHVARRWAKVVVRDSRRAVLGRAGVNLAAAEDSDLALTACDVGLGFGLFPRLKVNHLISAHRMTIEHVEGVVAGMAESHVILESLRDPQFVPQHRSPARRLVDWFHFYRMSPQARRIEKARRRGRAIGYRNVRSVGSKRSES
jgi:glycosyltransferase involved in cell wall biosynthesis